MTGSTAKSATDVLESFAVPGVPLYLVGTYERGVTVYSQQIRAFNLVWSLVQRGVLTCDVGASTDTAPAKPSIAIVGGGFAGLSVAAALLKKRVNANITIFEQRDTLLPLQHGSDTRWLHPRIYNWPDSGSESEVAMLPILNWTAARASDVAAQILWEWRAIGKRHEDKLNVYCNARHLQIHEAPGMRRRLKIEWVGDHRRFDGTSGPADDSVGETKAFDHVILAVGFGLEREHKLSYWRNDILGQPSLEEPHRLYLVSGQGDGAMIDVLRIRISQYRPDRILEELFARLPKLHQAVISLRLKFTKPGAGMFAAFEALEQHTEFNDAIAALKNRLRRDTSVILHLKQRTFAKLFEVEQIKISFQNRLLIYLLYKCGGFVPTFEKCVESIAKAHGIPDDQIVCRHGPDRAAVLMQLLSDRLYKKIDSRFGKKSASRQSEIIRWTGGYFGYPGSSAQAKKLDDDKIRQGWRKEYLPPATALAALSLCTAVGGLLRVFHPNNRRLRVTLHRTMAVGEEELLQQCCEYVGNRIRRGRTSAARTFPVNNATIGLAYQCRSIVRSKKAISAKVLRDAMQELDLNAASRDMSPSVRFVLAIPILQPTSDFWGTSPVAGVLYVDSEAEGFFVDDKQLKSIASMMECFATDAAKFDVNELRRISNLPIGHKSAVVPTKRRVPAKVKYSLEAVRTVAPPLAKRAFRLNFDYVDFAPMK